MSVPVPVLGTNPVGLTILGVAGFLTYKAGKKAGHKSEKTVDQPGLADKTIKGAMKAAYRAQKSVAQTFGGTKEKYTGMWKEARSEVNS